jgi:hypothetical protein
LNAILLDAPLDEQPPPTHTSVFGFFSYEEREHHVAVQLEAIGFIVGQTTA